MMNARAVRAEFDATHVASPFDRKRQHEDARHVRTIRREHERCWQCDNQIGVAKLPSSDTLRSRRQVARIPFARAISHPLFEDRDLRIRERIQTDELVARGINFPWRHDTRLRDESDLRRVRARLAIGQQTEWRRSTRIVALSALAEHDRGDVFGEGDLPERARRQQGENHRNQSYVLVNQSVTAEILVALMTRAMANKRQKHAFFCHKSLFVGRFPQYTGWTFLDIFAPSSRTA